ncbi:MAG: alpha/beta hydrolase-fold protein [Bacteroidota bacterium]
MFKRIRKLPWYYRFPIYFSFFIVAFIIFKPVVEYFEHRAYVATLEDTSSENVYTLKDTIEVPYLGEKRTLWVYLPPSYDKSDTTRYPVLYFMDGGALFSDLVNEGPEWQVDEHINLQAKNGGPEVIVIGIDNSKKRNTEYKPLPDTYNNYNEEITGPQHAQWIAQDLKLWIDQRYRTLATPEHTCIGGASLGGLMSYYMLMTYPDVFHKAIVFSPSFWVNEQMYELHQKVPNLQDLKIYMNVGEKEGEVMVAKSKRMADTLRAIGMDSTQLKFNILPNAIHRSPTWRKGFAEAYPWIVQ